MNISKHIENVMNQKGITKQWLADKLNINYKTFVGKLKRNSITAEELLEIAYYLNIDLNELKTKLLKERVSEMKKVIVGNLVIPYENHVETGKMTDSEWEKFEKELNNDPRIERINDGFICLNEDVEDLINDYPYLKGLRYADDVVDFDESRYFDRDEKDFLRRMITRLINEKGWQEFKENYRFYLNEIVGLNIDWNNF